VKGILEADSPRVSDIGRAMGGHSPEANCRGVYRFLQKTDPREALRLMYREDAEYVIGDVTEMRRPQALRTEYVGYLKDGKTRGYDLWVLSVPYGGRGIPPGELLLEDFSAGGEKDLLLEKIMPKRRDILEKLLALMLLAYGIGVLVGENLRDQVYRGKGKKWSNYSGIFDSCGGVGGFRRM
jgi:hypothetical protein